ncbi:LysR family transcriptional regulator [Aquabacter sp. L1I39]|uniref:LysR family transcriptional regulator n=1 Tax=Aquabacter sp. L1I39 TaxID=2820278 RepID=UPI001ADB73C1|nr:LysR substrate-binding domain-containing protein [Aquabacter sp. L1I39]QTL01856.1 LysR family transcriptional regulator [Aquabacter sp. L1I39]
MPTLAPSRTFLRQIDLGTLDLFVLVCETGSIARAAARGNIAASALSRRICELERLLGGPLLVRHARGVRPTDLGAQVLEHGVDILVEVERLRIALGEFSQGVRGRVRLAASASAVEQFLPADLAAFAADHPEIRIALHQSSSQEVARAVLAGEADLGICGESETAVHLPSRPYRAERLVLVTRLDHPLADRPDVAFAETLDFEQVGMRGSSTVQINLNREAREARRALRQRVEVNSLSAMCRMIECGMGIGVMASGAFQALGKTGLAAIPLTDPWASRTLNLYAVDFVRLPAPARRLADALATASA